MTAKKTSKARSETDQSGVADAETVQSGQTSDSLNDTIEDIHDAVEEDVTSGPENDTLRNDAPADAPQDDDAPDQNTTSDHVDDEGNESEPLGDAVEPDDILQPETETQTEIVRTETVVERKGGFIPMVLGGIVAGGIGFGAAYFVLPDLIGNDMTEFEQNVTASLEAQSSQIDELSDRMENLPPPTDLSRIETAQSEMSTAIEGLNVRIGEIGTRMDAFDTRLTELETRPIAEGASDAAVAAYERELQALQDAMAAQRREIEAMMSEAQAAEDNAEETAEAAMRRAALTRIQTAIDAGSGFAPALADLQATGVDIPQNLNAHAEEGVASLAELQNAFPAVAREALAASRRVAAEAGEGGGFGAFLKTQLGARSLEPREGSDPDAILSRAEAAVREGRLTDALAEIEALPEEGKAEISDWAARVSERLEVVAATETLGQDLK